jgi:hypothetical protein
VQSVQGPKTLRSVFVGESSWVARLLADIFDFVCVPCGVACEQDVARRGVQQYTDTAGGVAGETHEDNGTVAEEIVAAREGQDWRTVEVIVDRCAAVKRVADPSDGCDGSRCDPVVFGPVQIYGQSGQIKKSAHVVPVCVRRQGEIDVGTGVSLFLECGYCRNDIGRGSHRGSHYGGQLRDSTYTDIDANGRIHDERRRGMGRHEGRERVLDPSWVNDNHAETDESTAAGGEGRGSHVGGCLSDGGVIGLCATLELQVDLK